MMTLASFRPVGIARRVAQGGQRRQRARQRLMPSVILHGGWHDIIGRDGSVRQVRLNVTRMIPVPFLLPRRSCQPGFLTQSRDAGEGHCCAPRDQWGFSRRRRYRVHSPGAKTPSVPLGRGKDRASTRESRRRPGQCRHGGEFRTATVLFLNGALPGETRFSKKSMWPHLFRGC